VRNTQHKYTENASKVISSKGGQKGPTQEGIDQSGEAATLVGRKLAGFGDRVVREKPVEEK
jgi:hypothetical protein